MSDPTTTPPRHRRRGLIAAALSLGLVMAALPLQPTPSAHAADGFPPGQSLIIGVAADNFSTKGVKGIGIEPNTKLPGTVMIARADYKNACLVVGGMGGVTWADCTGRANVSWIIEPLDTATTTDAEQRDNTLAANNVRPGSPKPRFVVRSWQHPEYCLARPDSGFFGEKMFALVKCTAAETAKNKSTQFAIQNDPILAEWEFLRAQMFAGAVALSTRTSGAQSNLWVKPFDANNEPVGQKELATADGYFLPNAVTIDPAMSAAVLGKYTVSQDCPPGGLWWSVRNSSSSPATHSISSSAQRTDDFSWGLDGSVSLEKEFSLLKVKVGVTIGAHVAWSTSKSLTRADTTQMTIAPEKYGSIVVSTYGSVVNGNWKTGTAYDRVWKSNGSFSIAAKSAEATPETMRDLLESNDRKSCLAQPRTEIEQGTAFRVIIPEQHAAPVVGDEVAAEVTFRVPLDATTNALDVRYQWFAGDMPIVGQSAPTLVVTPDLVGKQLSFTAYENGGTKRYESLLYSSQQTAPVVVTPSTAPTNVLRTSVNLPLAEGIVGRPYELAIRDIDGIADDLHLDASSLPAGLTFDTHSGTITGVPTQVGATLITLLDDDNLPITAEIVIDPAPTVFPIESGTVVQAGDALVWPLVLEAATDATYAIEFMTADGRATAIPAGLNVVTTDAGVPVLSGTPTTGADIIVRVTEQSPHAAGDARQIVNEMQLMIDDSTTLVHNDGDVIELPHGEHVTVPLAEILNQADAVGVQGTLPAGLVFDAESGTIVGTPEGPGATPVVITTAQSARSATVTIEVFGAPQITVERMPDAATFDLSGTAAESTDMVWHASAPGADAMTAVLRAKNGSVIDEWMITTSTHGAELDIYLAALPERAGDYVIDITATNQVGEMQHSIAVTVQGADEPATPTPEPTSEPTPEPTSASGAGGAPSAETGLPVTGTSDAMPGLLIAAGLLAVGMLLAWRRRVRA